jgi:glucose-6-phosphate 1-dehydrogenase
MAAPRSDALVLFGVTGDLAHKMIFPARYAMVKRGTLKVPVVGVASSPWSLARLRQHATEGIRKAGRIDDRGALHHLLSLLRFVSGDYNDQATFLALKRTPGDVRRPAHYLAIPPALFETVIKGLGAVPERGATSTRRAAASPKKLHEMPKESRGRGSRRCRG